MIIEIQSGKGMKTVLSAIFLIASVALIGDEKSEVAVAECSCGDNCQCSKDSHCGCMMEMAGSEESSCGEGCNCGPNCDCE